MKKILTLFAAVFACVLLSLGLSACGGNGDKNSLTFNTLTVDGTEVYGKVSNDTEEFSFEEEISVSGKTKFLVALDELGTQTLIVKTIPLEIGNNLFYVFEILDDELQNTYAVTIRRRPMYTVTFETNNETEIEPQTVEEDGFAEKPDNPIKLGCDFTYWNYDFTKPITENTTIAAKFEVKEEMAAFTFASTATTCEIVRVKDTTITKIVIPDYVTSIGNHAFSDCSSLTSVTIPNSVTSIGSMAFYGCNSLMGVYITNIENWYNIFFEDAYANPLYNAKNLYLNEDLVKDLVIPNTVINISNFAFFHYSSLRSVTIPDSVISIGQSTFYDCSDLTKVIISNSVTSIGSFAFSSCKALTSITIPDNVTSIGNYAFNNCDNLTSIIVSEKNPTYRSVDGNLYSKDGKTLIQYACGKNANSFTIPDSVTSIDSFAFSGCDSLARVVIGNGVTAIEGNVFSGCDSLTSITVDKNNINYQSIDGNLYRKGGKILIQYAIGKKASSFIFPNGVTSIGYEAFADCSSLTSITIPDSITSIGYEAFADCDGLTSVYYKGTAEDWAKISIDNSNGDLTNATRYYYSETKPTETGNYWHYVDGVPTAW